MAGPLLTLSSTDYSATTYRSGCSSETAGLGSTVIQRTGLSGSGRSAFATTVRSSRAGKPHPYIPLLAAHPTIQSRGYGTSIVRHLIAEAVLLTRQPHCCHDVLFLDVYTTNEKANGLYEKFRFETMSPEPILDPDEDGALYIIMAKRVTIAVA